MTTGLNVSRIVNVQVNISPLAAQRRGFGTLLILGDSTVIDGQERFRTYTDSESVGDDFGLVAPEYLAAELYFSQVPKPRQLMVGRWLQAATSGFLRGGVMTAADQVTALAALTVIEDGTIKVTVDGGTAADITGIDMSAQTTLEGCATVITTAMTTATAGCTCVFDGTRFNIISATTGVDSSVGFAAAVGSGTDISALLRCTAATASGLVPGYAAEEPVASVAAMANQSGAWYGLNFATTNALSDSQILAVAAYIEAASTARVFGVTETNANVLDSTYTTDIAYKLEDLSYRRTVTTYSANEHAICSALGRAFSVNFSANRSTITLKFKQMPGITSEVLTESQALALAAKKCNVFAAYNNDTAIFQEGVMADGSFFDEVHGLDWFADAMQNALYNLLYTSRTKIPQTEPGVNQLVAEAAKVCEEAINNGLIAPGTWNADGFGQLERGDFLPEGFYIYAEPIDDQAQADREARKAPVMQVAVKLAGAFHTIDAIVNVNR